MHSYIIKSMQLTFFLTFVVLELYRIYITTTGMFIFTTFTIISEEMLHRVPIQERNMFLV